MNPILNLNATFTGAVVTTFASAEPPGWRLLNGSTIGSASSGATYANAAAKNLFTFLWTNLSNTVAPVSSGRGASAAADWTANKTLTLPDARGRSIIGVGTGLAVETVTSQTAASNAIPVASNIAKWNTGMQVTVSGASGFSGLTNGTWFIFRQDATSVKFASTLANAQNAAVATITGTGSCVITHTLAARKLGEFGGEENHAMSASEMLAHNHGILSAGSDTVTDTHYVTGNGGTTNTRTDLNTATGGNVPMNNMQPFLALNYVIKL
jgi:microcystin-dependent protein